MAGIAIGTWAHDTGAGILGAVIVGFMTAAIIFGLFQLLLLVARPAWARLVMVFAFIAPAVVAGYHAALGIVKRTMPSDTWQFAFAVTGALAVGASTFMRLTMMAPPNQPSGAFGVPRDRMAVVETRSGPWLLPSIVNGLLLDWGELSARASVPESEKRVEPCPVAPRSRHSHLGDKWWASRTAGTTRQLIFICSR